MATPNTGIPYVPENTTDPAAGLNLALNVIDALLQTAVIDMDQTSPPGSPSDGDLHIVGTGATGAWAGQANNLARYVAEGNFWQFYEAGINVHLILNLDEGAGLYAWDGAAWVAPIAAGSVSAAAVSYSNTASGLSAADVQAALDEIAAAIGGGGGSADWGDIGGTLSDQSDLQDALNTKAEKTLSMITESSTSTMVPETHAGTDRYIRCAGNVTFNVSESYSAGESYNIRATAGISLIGTGVTLTAPSGGTLNMTAAMSVTVVMTSSSAADVIGQTVPA